MRTIPSALVALFLIAGLATPAWSQDDLVPANEGSVDDDGLESAEPSATSGESNWSMLLLGGVMLPLGDTDGPDAVSQQSLAGTLRVGWISSVGLGIDVAAGYAPLSRTAPEPDLQLESHLATVALMPRFTLGKNMWRLWISGGGGAAYERTRLLAGTEVRDSGNGYALLGAAAAGLEFHPFSGLGLAVTGTYHRTRGDFTYELVSVTGGLALSFR